MHKVEPVKQKVTSMQKFEKNFVLTYSQTITGTTGSGLLYSASNNQITITGYTGLGGMAVSIPTIHFFFAGAPTRCE